MKWNYQIKELLKKLKYFIFLFHRISSFMNKKTLKIIYHALIESIINYGITAWGSAYNNILKSILINQRKIINKLGDNVYNILDISKTYIISSLSMFYDECKVEYENVWVNTRNRSIPLPKINKKIASKSARYTAIKYFNKLPNNLKSLKGDKKSNKKNLLKWIINIWKLVIVFWH